MGKLQLFGFSNVLSASSVKIYNKKIIKKFGNQLKVQANNLKVPSLSLLQIGIINKLCAILKPQHIKDNRWYNYNQIDASKYNLYPNLQIADKSIASSQVWEQSPSYPGFKFLYNRSDKIKIKYDNEQMKQTYQEVSGFSAILIQNQVDVFEGKILFQQCLDFEIINPELKQKHQQVLKQKLKEFKRSKQEKTTQQQQQNKTTQCFNQLKRQAIYRIIDFYRKKM